MRKAAMKTSKILLLLVFFELSFVPTFIRGLIYKERKPYIVYMGELSDASTPLTTVEEHNNLLYEAIGDHEIAEESKVHSYVSFNAFVARLLPHEASRLSKKEGVVSVFPNTVRRLQTTRSWDFIGMPETVSRNHKAESDVIIGFLDTGIWSESPSFSDKGYGPPPSKWKGKCMVGINFTGCNNKVIGARYHYLEKNPPEEELSPADFDGHGTHTASIAAGIPVTDASLYGYADGTARGGVPSARIAMYKVCWKAGCTDMDIMAGFDAALRDGVDIISVSLAGNPRDFFKDSIAIGAFHAQKKHLFVVAAGGNFGPKLSTVQNVAPWIMTVAASSIDRQFQTDVRLGNGMITPGISINTFSPEKQIYPLTNGARAANTGPPSGNASACDFGTLNRTVVEGKIIHCIGNSRPDLIIKNTLGGSGVIMSDDPDTDEPTIFLIPAAVVTATNGRGIDHYIGSTKNPSATIYKSRTVNITAPFVASFSSRGPQNIVSNLLKPDVAAPGLAILAAYSELTTISGANEYDNRFSKYNILSGTSIACPHVAAAAAYVKSFHPDWSPDAIKSALMTTATPMKTKKMEAAELGSGSGQINPTAALDPGLVYDRRRSSFIAFLCKQGYATATIRQLTGGKHLYNCSYFNYAEGADGLNYPTIHLQLPNRTSDISAVFYRNVTNVGFPHSTYISKVESPEGLNVTVVPPTLSFHRLKQIRHFKVLLKGKFLKETDWALSASLEWSNFNHSVRSPILVYRDPNPMV